MERIIDWETSLSDYIASRREMPFEYGSNDCCLFGAGAVEAMTGTNPMADFVGQYDSLKTSLQTIKSVADTLEQAIDDRFPIIEIGYAQRGDLAFCDNSVGVVVGSFAWFTSDDGLERVPRELWDKAWGVGHG